MYLCVRVFGRLRSFLAINWFVHKIRFKSLICDFLLTLFRHVKWIQLMYIIDFFFHLHRYNWNAFKMENYFLELNPIKYIQCYISRTQTYMKNRLSYTLWQCTYTRMEIQSKILDNAKCTLVLIKLDSFAVGLVGHRWAKREWYILLSHLIHLQLHGNIIWQVS